MTVFEFATAGQIIFGWGALSAVPEKAVNLGKRAILISGEGGAKPERVQNLLEDVGIAIDTAHVSGEPSIAFVSSVIRRAKDHGADFVVAFGGGSVLDTGKAVSAMLTNSGDLLDYLEVVGRGMKLNQRAAPLLAVPTTAGTGSEVTRNAVLSVPDEKLKVSLRSPLMLPAAAVVDPELTVSVPPAVTASTGMDALTQVIEPYVSTKANALTDLYAREGIRVAGKSLVQAYHHGDDQEARTGMAWTSLLGGLCLANAGLGAVHGFASPIGGMFDAPHGAICARLLPFATQVNIRALQSRLPGSQALKRYTEIAEWIAGEGATLAQLVDWLVDLAQELEIPALSAYGVTSGNIQPIVAKAKNASSMRGNPISLHDEELCEILEKAL